MINDSISTLCSSKNFGKVGRKKKLFSTYPYHEKFAIAYMKNSLIFLSPSVQRCLLTWKRKLESAMHTVSFVWFLSGSEWILNLEFCLLKLLIFYQKLLWNIRSRLNSSTFWVFRPVFRYVWSKLKLFAQKIKIFIIHM